MMAMIVLTRNINTKVSSNIGNLYELLALLDINQF